MFFNKVIFIIFLVPLLVFSQKTKNIELKYGYDLPNYEKYMPTSSCGEIIHYKYFSFSFCENYKLSEWGIYYMTKDRLNGKNPRLSDFRIDPRLKKKSAGKDFYYRSGYDRGHIVPAKHMTFDSSALSESFYYTNMAPQHPSFHRLWNRQLKSKFINWVSKFDTVAVISGWITNNISDYIKKEKTLFKRKDSIPLANYHFKVLVDIPNKRSLAFLMPQFESFTGSIFDYAISIADLEEKTGLDFFYKVDVFDEVMLEMNTDIKSVIKE